MNKIKLKLLDFSFFIGSCFSSRCCFVIVTAFLYTIQNTHLLLMLLYGSCVNRLCMRVQYTLSCECSWCVKKIKLFFSFIWNTKTKSTIVCQCRMQRHISFVCCFQNDSIKKFSHGSGNLLIYSHLFSRCEFKLYCYWSPAHRSKLPREKWRTANYT